MLLLVLTHIVVLLLSHLVRVYTLVLDLYSLQVVLVNVYLLLSLVRIHHLEILAVLFHNQVLLLRLDLDQYSELVVLPSVGHMIMIRMLSLYSHQLIMV